MLGERLGQLGDAPHFAALLRDWESFAAIDPVTGLPIDSGLLERYDAVSKNFIARLEECRAAEFLIDVLEDSSRFLSQIRQSEAASKYPFVQEGSSKTLVSTELSEVKSRANQMIAVARLLLAGPNLDIKSLPQLLEAIKSLEMSIRKSRRASQKIIQDEVLLDIISAGRELAAIQNFATRLSEQLAPIGERYLTAFADYIITVIESLLLKLEIIELETKLQIYDNATCSSLTTLDGRSAEYHASIGRVIHQKEAQLYLFQQLGPAVTNIAQQYQQILSQIELVNEDLAQLR